jgi:hypothetical protein
MKNRSENPPDFPNALYHERLVRGAATLDRPTDRRGFGPAFTDNQYAMRLLALLGNSCLPGFGFTTAMVRSVPPLT